MQASRFIAVLEALPGKVDVKRHSPSILYLTLELNHYEYTKLVGKPDQMFKKPDILFQLV